MRFLKFITLGLIIISLQAFAGTIDLSNGYYNTCRGHYLRTIANGDSVVFTFRGNAPSYVESILIAAEGRQSSYSFGKVYVDGDEVATLGVPGYDPTYPIIIRDRVSTIEIVATNGSRFKIQQMKIFTTPKVYRSYLSRRYRYASNYNIYNWGDDVISILYEWHVLHGSYFREELKILRKLKRRAMRVAASERVRDLRSLVTFRKAKKLLEIISEFEEHFLKSETFIFDYNADRLITDLMTIKEDILEKYDIYVQRKTNKKVKDEESK